MYEDPEKDSDLPEVTLQVRGKTEDKNPGLSPLSLELSRLLPASDVTHFGEGFAYKASRSGFCPLPCLPTMDSLALKFSSWESQLLFISFQMEC